VSVDVALCVLANYFVQMAIFYVVNDSPCAVEVFVSSYTGGDDSWLILDPHDRQVWNHRKGWETVAFKDPRDSSKRGGIYAPVGSVVVFNGDFKKIEVK